MGDELMQTCWGVGPTLADEEEAAALDKNSNGVVSGRATQTHLPRPGQDKRT